MPRYPAASRDIPSGISRMMPRDAAVSHAIPYGTLAGSHRGPVGIHEQNAAVTSVETHEIRWEALGLGSGLGLGFSREFAGLPEKSRELVGKGVDINSRGHTRGNPRELTGTHGSPRKPIHPRMIGTSSGHPKRPCGNHVGQRFTRDPGVP